MLFARKNMELVNEINDKNASLNLIEPPQLGHPFIPRSALHRTSLNMRNSWQKKKTPTNINYIELQASFEVASKIRDCALALLELVLYMSGTIHANTPKIEQWTNINEKERRIYTLVYLAKEISQNHTDVFPEYLCCS
jgi:hypothetical protein